MYIEIKDLQTGTRHRVGAEGATLGRDPSRCTIVVGDKGVSSLHARLSLEGGRWMLEDLRSSNGTFSGEQRLTAPVMLKAGGSFALFRYRFDVLAAQGADGESTAMLDVVPSGVDEEDDEGKTQVRS